MSNAKLLNPVKLPLRRGNFTLTLQELHIIEWRKVLARFSKQRTERTDTIVNIVADGPKIKRRQPNYPFGAAA